MHELSVAQALVDQLGVLVRREGALRATAVTLRVGALSGVDAEALRLAFPVAAETGSARDAELTIEEVPVSAHCNACGRPCLAPFPFPACESCGSLDLDIDGGRDLVIASVELDMPARPAGAPV